MLHSVSLPTFSSIEVTIRLMFMDVCTWSHGLLIQQSPSAFQNLTVRGQMVCCNPTLRFLVTAEQSLAPISKRHKFKFVEVFMVVW